MKKHPITLMAITALWALTSACVFSFSDGTTKPNLDTQVIEIDAPSVRAKYDVINTISGKIVVKGVTPNTVVLRRTGSYRVKITHPKTGEVHTTDIESKKVKRVISLVPSEVTAKFKN